MKFNTRYDPPVVPGVVARGGLTDQHQKDDCDLNVILRRYRVGGLPPAPAARYEDLTDKPVDLQDAFDRVSAAVAWFDALPSDVRRNYGNDPRAALAAAMSGNAEDLSLLFPNHSKAADAATPEPPEAAKAAATAAAVDTPEPSPAAPAS